MQFIVGTPDHHHFHASLNALKRGKHVYCEKPLTHSVWEARELTKAARKAKVSTQMGNQAQASNETRRVQEFILDDAIGPIRKARVWTDRPSRGLFDEYWPQGVQRPNGSPSVPDSLDWNLWLGPAPERPYHPNYLPTKWRGLARLRDRCSRRHRLSFLRPCLSSVKTACPNLHRGFLH